MNVDRLYDYMDATVLVADSAKLYLTWNFRRRISHAVNSRIKFIGTCEIRRDC